MDDELIHIRVGKKIKKEMNCLIEQGLFTNQSEMAREAMRDLLLKYEKYSCGSEKDSDIKGPCIKDSGMKRSSAPLKSSDRLKIQNENDKASQAIDTSIDDQQQDNITNKRNRIINKKDRIIKVINKKKELPAKEKSAM